MVSATEISILVATALLILDRCSADFMEKVCVPVHDEVEDFFTLYRHGRSTGVSFLNHFRNSSVRRRPLHSTERDVVIVDQSSDFFKFLKIGAQVEAHLLLEVISGKFNGVFGLRNFDSSRARNARILIYFRKEMELEFVQPCGKDVAEFGNFDLLRFEHNNPLGQNFITSKRKGIFVMIMVEIVNVNGSLVRNKDGSLEIGVASAVTKMFGGNGGGGASKVNGYSSSELMLSIQMFTVGDVSLRRQAPTNLAEIEDYIKTEFPYFESLKSGAADLEYCLTDIRLLKQCKIHEVNNFTTPVFRQDHVVILRSIVNQIKNNEENAKKLYNRVQEMENCLPKAHVHGLNESFDLFSIFRARLNANITKGMSLYLNGEVSEDSFLEVLSDTYYNVRNELKLFNDRHRRSSVENAKFLSLFEILAEHNIKCWPKELDMNVVRFSLNAAPFYLLFDKTNISTLKFGEYTKDFSTECERCRKQCFLVNCEAENIDCQFYTELPVVVYYPSNISSSTVVANNEHYDVGSCIFTAVGGLELCSATETSSSSVMSYKYFFAPSVHGKFCT